MGIVRKQSAYSTVFIYLGFAIGALNTLWLMSHYVPKDINGLTNIIISVSVTFSVMSTLGSINALYKFNPFYRSYLSPSKNDLPFIVLFVNLIGCLLFVICSFIFKNFIARKLGHNSPLFIAHYHLIIPFTLTYSCLLILEAFCWIIKQTIAANIAKELVYRVTNTIIISLYIFKIISVNTFLMLFSFSYLPSVLMMLFVVLKDGTIKIVTTISNVSKRLYNKILVFASYHYSGMLIAIIPPAIDDVLIAGLSSGGLSNVWVYTIPVYLISVMDVPARSMMGITTTLIAEAWKNRDIQKIDELYKKSSLNLLIIGLALFSLIFLNIGNLERFLGKGYELITILFLIKGLAKLIDLGSGMNAQVLLLSKSWRIDFYTSAVFILVNIILDFLMIKKFGLIGAAYGSSIALIFYNFMRFFYLRKIYKLQPFTSKTFIALVFGAIAFLIVYFIPYVGNLFLDTIVRTIIFCVLYVPTIIYFKISEDINAMYQTALNKLLKKK